MRSQRRTSQWHAVLMAISAFYPMNIMDAIRLRESRAAGSGASIGDQCS